MRMLSSFVLLLAILVAAAGVFVWGGWYNVSASVPHWRVTHRLLEEARERSISRHSRDISVPSLNDPKLIDVGLRHFKEMCQQCHGAPGIEAAEFAQGLYPNPPDLARRQVQEFQDRELFWIVQNGIKMTGMPSFGETHSPEEIFGIVAFLRRLPRLSPDQYKTLAGKVGPMKGKKYPRH